MQEMINLFEQMMAAPFRVLESVSRSAAAANACGAPVPLAAPVKALAEACPSTWPAKQDFHCKEEGECCGVSCCPPGCRCDGGRCKSDCPCCERTYHTGSDRVRLVDYTLAEVRRGEASRVLEHHQEIFDDCTTIDEIHNQIITRYVCRHHEEKCKDPEFGKNLRVYTKVLDSWCKPSWDYEEAQIRALRGIQAAVAKS